MTRDSRAMICGGGSLVFLVAATAVLVALLYLSGLPAAFLRGAMEAAMLVVGYGGLRCTCDAFREVARALPQVLGSIGVLVAACGAVGWALTRVGQLDVLTACFARSPGVVSIPSRSSRLEHRSSCLP